MDIYCGQILIGDRTHSLGFRSENFPKVKIITPFYLHKYMYNGHRGQGIPPCAKDNSYHMQHHFLHLVHVFFFISR